MSHEYMEQFVQKCFKFLAKHLILSTTVNITVFYMLNLSMFTEYALYLKSCLTTDL
jgi:hypothetical protein